MYYTESFVGSAIGSLSETFIMNFSKLPLPLVSEHISAGFPSPAEDHIELNIDLNEYLIKNPSSTFFLRVNGNSMIEGGINNNDLLLVDRSLDPRPGKVVVAVIDGAFTVKRLVMKAGILHLEADNPEYSSIDLSKYENVQIWGVAIYSIHSLRKACS